MTKQELQKIAKKLDNSLGIPGHEDYILENLGMVVEAAHQGGNIYDVDEMVTLSKLLGFNVSYGLYSYLYEHMGNISFLDYPDTPETLTRIKHLVDTYMKVEDYFRVEGNFILGTAEEIAGFIVSKYVNDGVLEKGQLLQFQDFDFAIADEISSTIPLKKIAEVSTMYHGVKKLLNTGFDSDELPLLADYYGGGAGAYTSWYGGMDKSEAIKRLTSIIDISLTKAGSFQKSWLIIAVLP